MLSVMRLRGTRSGTTVTLPWVVVMIVVGAVGAVGAVAWFVL